jgi:precorrin-6B methylase 2
LLGADTSEPGCEELLRFLTQGYHFPSLVQAELESKSQYLRFLPYGTFSPHEALECLHDQLRTKRFIQAVCAHCEDLLGERQGELSVVDAGCGPLPVLAIAAAYCSPRVRVVGLESNPASADIAKRIVSSLGLDSQIEIVETNAVAWKSALPIDLLVSETLDSGLVRENFHQIVNHLRPYLSRKGRIVPEHLEIQGGFAQPEEFSRDHLEPILKWKTDEALGERISLPLSYALGELNPREGGAVVVQTRLTLYQRRNDKEPIELNPGESLITRRVVLRDAEQVLADLQSEDDTRGAPSRDQVVNISYHYPPGHRLLLTAKTAPS